MNKRIIIFGLFVSLILPAMAQLKLNAPYSRFGLGELNNKAIGSSVGMAGVGISNANGSFLNLVNPAMLTSANDTKFDVGINYEGRDLSEQNSSQATSNIGLSHLAIAITGSGRSIGVKKAVKTTAAFGIKPYSVRSYSIRSYSALSDNSVVQTDLTGSGSINKYFVSVGTRLLDSKRKNSSPFLSQLSLGVEGSFLSGSLKDDYTTMILNDTYASYNRSVSNYRGAQAKTGLAYRREIKSYTTKTVIAAKDSLYWKNDMNRVVVQNKDSLVITSLGKRYAYKTQKNENPNKGVFVNAGLYYEVASKLKESNVSISEKRRYPGGTLLYKDTLTSGNLESISMPQSIGLGLSIDDGGYWTLAADIVYTDWSSFQDKGKVQMGNSALRVAIGAELVSGVFRKNEAVKREKIDKRIVYRLGGYYEKTPYLYDGNAVYDYGINFGISGGLKSGDFSIPHYMTLGFTAGQRKPVNGGIKENYVLGSLNFTISDSWFNRKLLGL